MNVILYTKAGCQPCKLTAKKLEQIGVSYEAVRVDEYPAARQAVAELGYTSAPVVSVELGDGATWTWSGFKPSELEKLKKINDGVDPEVVFAA